MTIFLIYSDSGNAKQNKKKLKNLYITVKGTKHNNGTYMRERDVYSYFRQ